MHFRIQEGGRFAHERDPVVLFTEAMHWDNEFPYITIHSLHTTKNEEGLPLPAGNMCGHSPGIQKRVLQQVSGSIAASKTGSKMKCVGALLLMAMLSSAMAAPMSE